MPFPVDDRWIQAAEAKLGVIFPEALRLRLRRENGGNVGDSEWELHPVFDQSDRKRLKRTANDIVQETASARSWTGFPAAGIAIASDGYGNHLVLLPEEDGQPELSSLPYFWDHETGELQALEAHLADLLGG